VPIVFLACACQPSPPGEATVSGSGSAAEEEVPPAGSGTPASGSTAEADASGTGGSDATTAAGSGVRDPASLPVLMRQIGFDDASEADLAEFVHLPPGAEGTAGAFGGGAAQVRVALVGYPNPRYAAPHVSDIRERVRVIPSARESVATHGRWVIHVLAVDRATAEDVRDRLVEVLGWPVSLPLVVSSDDAGG
jgi:hypothetical protein